jgi:hypothetical protein
MKRRKIMKKMFLVTLVLFCGMALVMSPAALAGGKKDVKPAKEFICHITEIDCDAERAFGHVILVSVNAVPAHCNHGDHYPVGVVRDAEEECAEADDFDKCVRKFAIGAECSRAFENTSAVQQLCGLDFVPFDLSEQCPVE